MLRTCIFIFMACLAFSGCIKDEVKRTHTYTLMRPVYKTVAEVRSNITSSPAQAIVNAGKLSVRGNFIFLNELNKGVHLIDNSNPAAPRNVAFIAIPGCVDIAVKENILYADLYTDLVAIDISNPLASKTTRIVENVFPHRFYYGVAATGNGNIMVDWVTKDTTVTDVFALRKWADRNEIIAFADQRSNGGMFSSSVSSGGVGTNGSMARFGIVGNRLYTVGTQELTTFNVDNPAAPSYVSKTSVGWNIETIFPFKDRLFIGSATGMFIYSLANADAPHKLGEFSHVRACDPVIADDNYAWVTLRTGTACAGSVNQLEVLNVTNLFHPVLLKQYQLTNPHGLSKDGKLLFVCDGKDGLKVFDAADVYKLRQVQQLPLPEAYDVIAGNGKLLAVAKDGLYQYSYNNNGQTTFLSKIGISQ